MNGPNALTVDPKSPQRLYLAAWARAAGTHGDGGGIFLSEDAGRSWRPIFDRGFPIALYETVADLNIYLAEHRIGIDYAGLVAQVASPDVKGILQSLAGAGAIPEAAYREALAKDRPALQDCYRRHFHELDVAAIIFPTTPMPAAKIGEDETVMVNGVPVPTFPTYIRNTSPGKAYGWSFFCDTT